MARIMVVDDTAFMRTMLRNILIEMGHDVVAEASNGQEALSLYAFMKPDLVIMDITMPDMNGIEAVQRLKQMDSNAKIMMCSAMGQQGMVTRAIKAGALDFIVKPFQKERVIMAVVDALSKINRSKR
jgi:two-component system chemotaxis response regulator CheY